MAISSGTRLGPYEVVAPLGAGGMGEVWKARDTRLERSVAIKVLPAEFAENAALKLRFEREAKIISQLNHPHICTLYDVGEGYLVMELLEGESLADKLAKGPLPIDQVLRYGIEIAEALEKAHKAGVVHRDLKPGNIMITKSGAKLLDFGLAKPVAIFNADGATQHKPLTQEGSIVGTFQYMAPEQIEGGEVDARTDIFAFGAVLYEMATGRRAFDGKSKASLIASILTAEPQPISAVLPMTPVTFDRVVRTCLDKEPDQRWQSAHDVAQELRWIAENPTGEPRLLRRGAIVPWITVFMLLATAATFAVLWYRAASTPPRRLTVDIVPPPNTEFLFPFTIPAVSPDGRMIAYQAHSADGRFQLWIRHLDTGAATALSDANLGFNQFWSPDSRSLAFFGGGKLKRLEVAGGSVQTIADAPLGRGGAWLADGTIIFSPTDRSPLYRVPAAGGTASPLTKLVANHYSHRWPFAFPDGKHYGYLEQSLGSTDRNHIVIGAIGSDAHETLGSASGPAQYSPSGFLVYVQEHALMARPFDARRMRFAGDAFVLVDPVELYSGTTLAAFSVAKGVLVYQSGAGGVVSRLSWIDRNGKILETFGKADDYERPSLSRDGRRLTYDVMDSQGNADIWMYDLVRHTETRLTFEPGADTNAIWSPDSQWIAYHSEDIEKGAHSILRKATSGVGSPETLFKSDAPFIGITDWSSDGRFLIFHAATGFNRGQADVFAYSFADHQVRPIIHSQFNELTGRLSPDGRWLAYVSNESSRNEVYVVPFPTPTTRVQISTAGGIQPRWSSDGSEIYYQSPDAKIMAVPVKAGSPFEAGEPHALFSYQPKPGGWQYDVSRDGRFIVNQPERNGVSQPFTVVLNWEANLKQ